MDKSETDEGLTRRRLLAAHSGDRSATFRVVEPWGDDCGWNPEREYGIGVALTEYELYVTGPWVASFDLDVA